MAAHELIAVSDDWYTPKYVFDALGCEFDLDVAHPEAKTHVPVPSNRYISSDSLNKEWRGFIWMNPPWCKKSDKIKWVKKFIERGNGIALMPDRTSAPWWQYFAKRSDAVHFVSGKIKFERPDGSIGGSPSTGSTLFGIGERAEIALMLAEDNGLGITYLKQIKR